MSSQPAVIRDNQSKQERVAIKKLQKRVDIVIKPADNGSGTVIMATTGTLTNALDSLTTTDTCTTKNKLKTLQDTTKH